MTQNLQAVKIVTPNKELVIENIVEYVCGFSYFYLRKTDGETISINRNDVSKIYRRLKSSGRWKEINLKKPKYRKES